MAQSKITIRTIAKLCGVSVSTVSLAINNKPGVRPCVRDLIRKTIEDLGWRCNSLDKRLNYNSENGEVVFVASPWLLSNFGGHPIQLTVGKLIEKFESQGIIPSVYYGRNLEVLENCLKRRPSVVVVFSNNFLLKGAIEKLLNAGVRVVIAHAEWRDAICPRIHSDHVNAGRCLGLKMQEAGCIKPAFLGGLGLRVHCETREDLDVPMVDYLTGLLEVYPDFDFKVDVVGDACGETSELERMLREDHYDGWIFQLRQYFDRFSFVRSRIPDVMPIKRIVTFDTAEQPAFSVSAHGCLAENSAKIAELVFQQAIASETPEPLEYVIPYLWRGNENDY